jgi:purine-binding chemotaxis protein CheW
LRSLSHLVVFTLDEERYALPLDSVERIVRAAAVTPLPKAPEIVFGIIAVRERIIPVVNVRKRFRLPEREIGPADQFIIARARSLTVALAVDTARNVMELPEAGAVAPDAIMTGMEYVAGVAKTADGMVLIHDLDAFLSLAEENALAEALRQGEE